MSNGRSWRKILFIYSVLKILISNAILYCIPLYLLTWGGQQLENPGEGLSAMTTNDNDGISERQTRYFAFRTMIALVMGLQVGHDAL